MKKCLPVKKPVSCVDFLLEEGQYFSGCHSESLNNILLRGVCGRLPRRWVRRSNDALLPDPNLLQPCSPFLFCHILSSAAASGTS